MEKEERLIDLPSRSPSIREKTGIKFIGAEEKIGGGIRSFADKSALGFRDARMLKRAKTDLGAEVPVSTAPNRYAAPAAIASVAISVNARMVTGPIVPLLILARPTLQPTNANLALITSAVQATTSMPRRWLLRLLRLYLPGSVKRIFLTCRAFTGDLEHGQAVMGLTQGGSDNYNDPLTISSRAQRQVHSTLLLMPRRRGGRWQITRGDPAQAPLGTQAGSTTP